jgi:hypothetical protein
MNWLIYIGGGYIFCRLMLTIFDLKIEPKEDTVLQVAYLINFISIVCIWIWICWKFIR